MTTHGAKGLESPIVILPDTGDKKSPRQDEIIPSPDGTLMWKTGADLRPPMMTAAIERAQQARHQEASRLLYVALTRAEKWLIVCASGDVKAGGDSWYRRAEAGMIAAGAGPYASPTGQGLRIEHGDWPGINKLGDDGRDAADIELPGWASTRAAVRTSDAGPISPSDLPGDKSLAAEFQHRSPDDAALHGRQIHTLLEHLPNQPVADWPAIAAQLLNDASENQLADLMKEVANVINNADFADLFGPDTLAEVDISAALPDLAGQRIRGTIDRLVISPTRILIVDFKSNRVVPATAKDTPVGIVRQMAAYLAAVRQIYPDHDISTAIVWTNTATLMPLPHDIVRASLQTLPHLDVPTHHP